MQRKKVHGIGTRLIGVYVGVLNNAVWMESFI